MATSTAPTKPTIRRDSRVAVALSLIPGLGQLYNGQPGKAARLLVGTAASIVGSLAIFLELAYNRDALYSALGVLVLALSLLAVVVFLVIFVFGLFLWGSAVYDAHVQASRLARGEPASRQIAFFHL